MASGIAYGDAGRYGDAIGAFNRVLKLDPTNGLAYQNLASMVLRQALASTSPTERTAKVREAETYARKAIDVDPALADAFTDAGRRAVHVRPQGRGDRELEARVELDPAQFNALYNLWFELAESGRRDEAVLYGRQFVATAPPAFFAPDIARIRAYLGAPGV
jgi:tetratricopeptide (TPR) repeat protein